MKESIVLELKDRPSVVNYVQLLQGNISRMSTHSGVIKSSICVIYTVLITILIAVKQIDNYWWLTMVVTVIGIIIDSYYLALERIYVIKYNSFIEKLNNGILDEKEMYDMSPRNTKIKTEFFAMILSSLTSFSVYFFYLSLIIISFFLWRCL